MSETPPIDIGKINKKFGGPVATQDPQGEIHLDFEALNQLGEHSMITPVDSQRQLYYALLALHELRHSHQVVKDEQLQLWLQLRTAQLLLWLLNSLFGEYK